MAKKSQQIRKKAPYDYPKQLVWAEDAGIAARRTELAKLSSAVLYKVLVLKNVPCRSKFRSKVARVRALEGRVNAGDLAAVGVVVGDPRVTPAPKKAFHVVLPHAAPAPLPHLTAPHVKPGKGERFDVPVGGIDVHMDPLVVAIADPTGITAEQTFPYTESGLRDLVGFFRFYRVEHVAMESTAEYWVKVFWALTQAGFTVLVANPVQTKTVQGQKTDEYDAQRIVLAFRDGSLKPSVLCTPAQYTRRKINRDAAKRVKEAGKAVCRLKVMYHVFDAPDWVAELHESQRGRRVLARCLAFGPANTFAVDIIVQVLAEEYAKYKGKVEDPAVLLKMAAEVAAFLYRLDKVPGSRLRLAEHLEDFASNRRIAEQLRAEVLRQVAQDSQLRRNLQLLLSIPGVGEDTALTILVEIVDIKFFWHAKALAKWAGLAARVNQSGYRKRATGHIYKGGNKWLREACYLIAQGEHGKAKAEGHPVGDFASRLQHAEKKPYKVAVTAGARHVLSYVYHVLTNQKPFEALWAEQSPARVEANRRRKLATLEKILNRTPLDDLLPRVLGAVRKKCSELQTAEDTCAALVGEILGFPLETGPP